MQVVLFRNIIVIDAVWKRAGQAVQQRFHAGHFVPHENLVASCWCFSNLYEVSKIIGFVSKFF